MLYRELYEAREHTARLKLGVTNDKADSMWTYQQ
jgi:hypothetical protein